MMNYSLRLWSVLFLCLLSFSGKADILDQSQKVSLIFVGPAKGLSESSFGHVALKFSPDKDGGLLDMVVEFVADIPRNESAIKKYIHGAGIGKKYPTKAELSPFYDFRKTKTITENRTLTVYDLNLSQDEVKKVVEFVQDYQNRDVGESYLFLTKNCSYFAAHALEVATGKKINKKNLPWLVDNNLTKLNLITGTKVYPDASSERIRLAEKSMTDGLGDNFPQGWSHTFTAMLGETNFALRQSSYLKLLWLQNNGGEKRKVQSLLRYLLSYENDVNQFTIRNLFRDPELKKVILLPNVRLEGGNLPKAKSFKHELVLEKDAPVIRISWSGKDAARVSVPLKQITFDNELALKYQDKIVGRYIHTKNDQWILSQRLDYGIDVDRDGNIVRSFLYIDLSDNVKSLKLSLDEIKAKGMISLNNAIDFKSEGGSCYAMALLQKALVERAIFMPELSAKQTDKFLLMRELLNNKFVAITGYSNITEFTKSIPKEELKTFIRTVQQSLQKGRVAQMRENILEREILDKVTDERLKAMLDEGLIVPLVIGMSEKGKLKPASDYAHIILAHDMRKIPEGYRITAYDPNAGINTLFVLNQNFRMDYPFYDKNYDYVALIDRIDPTLMTLDHAVRSRGVDHEKLKGQLRGAGALVLEPAEITKALP